MNQVSVRCWKLEEYRSDLDSPLVLYITYPEDNSGHDLITCTHCGAIYAVTISKLVYVGPPLEVKLVGISCTHCSNPLAGNYAYYPETYILDGKQYLFKRPQVIPPDEDSIVKDFEGIYE